MVSYGAPGCANRADNSNIITLVTTIIMLPWLLYCSIFRTLAYFMSEAYSEPGQMFKIISPDINIARTICSGIFTHIQGHPIFSHVQAYWGICRYY